MSVNAIWEAIKDLAQSFHAATIFPSFLLVLVHYYWVLPVLFPNFDPTSGASIAIAIALVLLFSYTFYAFNYPLIRLVEGYKLNEFILLRPLLLPFRNLHRERHQKLIADIKYARTQRDLVGNDPKTVGADAKPLSEIPEWNYWNHRLAELQMVFDRDYPGSGEALLPTSLGNIIAAFEDYPRKRYGIESVAVWPRLLPILKSSGYLEFIAREKAVFDFMLNTGLVTTALGVELFYLNAYAGDGLIALGLLAVTLVICLIFYNGLVLAARQWGMTVRVAFDLYRHKLYWLLGLQTVENFEQEFSVWQKLSEMYFCRPPRAEFSYFASVAEVVGRQQESDI